MAANSLFSSPLTPIQSFPRRASQVVLMVKNLPANEGDVRDLGSVPELGRSPGEGHGNPLQYSCLENPTGRRAWQAVVHWVLESWTWLKQLSTHAKFSQVFMSALTFQRLLTQTLLFFCLISCNCPLLWDHPWTGEPGGLQSMGLQSVRHNWATKRNKNIQFNLY